MRHDVTHFGIAWVSEVAEWDEGAHQGAVGHWECIECMAMLDTPMGTGLCHNCGRPVDDLSLPGFSCQTCGRRSG